LSKVTVTSRSFTSSFQCVRFAARRRIQAGDATDQYIYIKILRTK